MRNRITRAALGVSLVGALGLPAAIFPTAAHATGWVATGTRAEPTAGLTDLGPLAPGRRLAVTVALRPRNQAAMYRDISAGTVLSRQQFQDRFAPGDTAVAQVVSYLGHEGFTGISVAANHLQVTATGTARQAETAFDTTLHALRLPARWGSRQVFANLSAARVPSGLGSTVLSVLGLSDVGTMSLDHLAATNPPSSCVLPGVGYPCVYNPQGFWKAYDAAGTATGAGTPIAILAEGDLNPVVKDLRAEEAANGLPAVPVSTIQTGPASPDTSGVDEWDLDTQYSTGMAGTVGHLYIYDATSLTDSDISREVNRFVSDDLARAGSASFGECEYQAYLDGSMLADDASLAEAVLQGQTLFASAGDTGGFCPVAPNNGVPAGVPDVNYPASSPYVVSVGGTTLITNSQGGYSREIAWLAGGGGVSLFESAPYWQAADGSLYAKLSTGCQVQGCGRTVPDVSNDADPNSGANVYIGGTPTAVGGTSLASPLTLGEWARMETAAGNRLGFAAPLFYKNMGSAAFHDITLGDTGPYPATPGYDLATGIGSLDVAQAVKIIG